MTVDTQPGAVFDDDDDDGVMDAREYSISQGSLAETWD